MLEGSGNWGFTQSAGGDIESTLLAERLNRDFFNPTALFELGKRYHVKGLHGLAAVLESAAIDARAVQNLPFPEAQLILGACYKAIGNRAQAEMIWLDALNAETLPEGRAQIATNLAGICLNDGRPHVALMYAEYGLEMVPGHPGCRANRGMACLELGRWAEGWDGFAATYETGDRVRRDYGLPEWAGKPNQRVIVFGDQGIGDEIMFAECLRDMTIKCEHVTVDCHPRLLQLFERSFPLAMVHGTRKIPVNDVYWRSDFTTHDAAIGLADLPRFFRRDAADWTGGAYLMGATQGADRGKRPERIGFAWRGGSPATRTDVRSVTLEMLEPIFRELEGRKLFALNYQDDTKAEVERFWKKSRIDLQYPEQEMRASDYSKAADFVASLDLVITVCTTMHHLAGALGVPCWTLVPKRPSWRYGVKGDRIPWYGSARLFRQEKDGDWGPIEQICEELRRI